MPQTFTAYYSTVGPDDPPDEPFEYEIEVAFDTHPAEPDVGIFCSQIEITGYTLDGKTCPDWLEDQLDADRKWQEDTQVAIAEAWDGGEYDPDEYERDYD